MNSNTKQWWPDGKISSSESLSNKVCSHRQSFFYIIQASILIKLERAIGTANPMVNLEKSCLINVY